MTETNTTPPAAPAPETAPAVPEGHPDTLDGVNAKLDKLADLVEGLLSKEDSAGHPAVSNEDRPVAEEVKEQLAQLKRAEDRKARADGQSAKVSELEGQVKKLTEKAPKEYRRITTFMWGGDV